MSFFCFFLHDVILICVYILQALSSLKHRVHVLERNLRLKEEELSSLRRDIKTTRLKELEVEKEVYYSEVVRLQTVTDRLKSELTGEVPQSKKFLRNKIDEQSKAIKKMKEKASLKTTEVNNLKQQLGLWKGGKAVIDEHETGVHLNCHLLLQCTVKRISFSL